MKTFTSKLALALLLPLLCGSALLAIKITIPKQYQEQVEAIKQAEKAELVRQLESVDGEVPANPQQNGSMQFSGGQNTATDSGENAVAEPLAQSLAEAEATAADNQLNPPAGQGFVSGQIVDKTTGQPLSGVAILLAGTEVGTITDAQGRYTLGPAPAATYTINLIKSGYIPANVTDFAVVAGEVSVFPFALPPRPAEMSDEVYVLQDFSVTAEEANQMMLNLDLRMDSDKMMNLFSAEDFSKFAASDVADALKRVAGVNIVEGQFAVIRGLEDRYSSTTYNGAPVPSPDPNSQSVQLDLFPSDVVTNLQIAKTFAGDLPSNSSGGNINIVTHDYPDAELEIKVKAGTGFEDNAIDRFLEFQDGSPVGREASTSDVIESDFSAFVGGRREWKEREVRFKGLVSNEIDYKTKVGTFEQRSPDQPGAGRGGIRIPGDLSLGQLSLSDSGRWDRTESERVEQTTAYLGLGFDLDKAGNHQIDASYFYTQKEEESVTLLENGVIPDRILPVSSLDARAGTAISFFDFVRPGDVRLFDANLFRSSPGTRLSSGDTKGVAAWIGNPVSTPSDVQLSELQNTGQDLSQFWFDPVFESTSVAQERELEVTQANGSHQLDFIDGLSFDWAVNTAETTQMDETTEIKYFFQADKQFLTTPGGGMPAGLEPILEQWRDEKRIPSVAEVIEKIGPGVFITPNGDIKLTRTDVEETQDFGRGDLHYDVEFSENLDLNLDAGVYLESAERAVTSQTLNNLGQGSVIGVSARDLGDEVAQKIANLNPASGFRNNTNDSEREIEAVYFNGKLTFLEKFDFLYGTRFESIRLTSENNPFEEDESNGTFSMFPRQFVLGRIIDSDDPLLNLPNTLPNPDGSFGGGTGTVSFDEATRDKLSDFVNGEIDEEKVLPSLGFAYRPVDGLSLRVAWSETVARPSFREMGYYITPVPGSSRNVVGNPLLQLSDVESYDFRVEYTWGNQGDLVAMSLFQKKIQKPIEQIRVRDPSNLDDIAIFQSWINNPNEADLQGVEFEFRKSLAFLDQPIINRLSLGGNLTLIDAEVERSNAETEGSESFFGVPSGATAEFTEIKETRRLFGQPEWIANFDLTFEEPDWGTKITLAWFSISDILDSAGSVISPPEVGRDVSTLSLDRYIGSFEQFDLIVTQKWKNWTFGLSIKNLTDSERTVFNDPDQTTGDINEESFKVGRDYSISASYTW